MAANARRFEGASLRLFTAIDVPEDWRAAATDAQQWLAEEFAAELRPVRRDQLHVTVRFLGEVPAEQAADLVRAIEAMPPLALELRLGAAGTFGPSARPTVVWLGVGMSDEESATLLGYLDRAIGAAGLTLADRPWRPHLTLARVRRQATADRARALAAVVATLPAAAPLTFTARSVSLYQSDLGNRAPHHKLLARSAIS